MTSGSLLRLETVSKQFGGLTVVDALSLVVPAGQAVGIIGPNGAGKTTLLNLISGTLRPDSGRVWLEGRDITGEAPSARCRLGVGRTFQIPHPFAGMTVFENVLVSAIFGGALSERAAKQHALALLEQLGLQPQANSVAGSLRLLDRKRLELARALATGPRLLLLDEIGGGLTDHEVHALVATIQALHQQGTTILWIEHIVHALLAVVNRLIVLDFGRLLADGEPRAVMNDAAVREIYLGIDADEAHT
jgi:branched-chain amino acid transport system ATP-binding protein